MPERSLKELLSSAQLAFSGVVEATGRSNAGGVTANERTVVVRVDRVLQAPAGLRLPPGSRVTVQLSPKLPPLGKGESAAFFADGLVYGDTLAVSEVARASAAETAVPTGAHAAAAAAAGDAVPVSPLEAAAAELAVDEVVEHARKADAVVRAHVIGLAHVPARIVSPLILAPAIWLQQCPNTPGAVYRDVRCDLLVRGKLPAGTNAGQTIHVLYANSLDVSWRQSPKPKAGQSGLWLLHRAPRELAGLAAFQLVHPVDLQPSLQLEVLRERGLASEAPEEEEEQAGADA